MKFFLKGYFSKIFILKKLYLWIFLVFVFNLVLLDQMKLIIFIQLIFQKYDQNVNELFRKLSIILFINEKIGLELLGRFEV